MDKLISNKLRNFSRKRKRFLFFIKEIFSEYIMLYPRLLLLELLLLLVFHNNRIDLRRCIFGRRESIWLIHHKILKKNYYYQCSRNDQFFIKNSINQQQWIFCKSEWFFIKYMDKNLFVLASSPQKFLGRADGAEKRIHDNEHCYG